MSMAVQSTRTAFPSRNSIPRYQGTESSGIDTKKEVVEPNGHPFKIGGGGTVIEKLLA